MRRKHGDNPKALTKSKELAVYQLLQNAGINFEFQKHMPFKGCGLDSETAWAMADFAITKPWGHIILECDEDQHKGYDVSCDPRRDFDIAASVALGSGGKLAMLRYNPDAFGVGGKTVYTSKKARDTRLLQVLTEMDADPMPGKDFARFFLFYDSAVGAELPLVAVNWPAAAREVSRLLPH